MEGSDDIFVHKFSISMGGKTLFKDAKLSLAHGRRYGLIGAPNAKRCGYRWQLSHQTAVANTDTRCVGRAKRLR